MSERFYESAQPSEITDEYVDEVVRQFSPEITADAQRHHEAYLWRNFSRLVWLPKNFKEDINPLGKKLIAESILATRTELASFGYKVEVSPHMTTAEYVSRLLVDTQNSS